ncbi:hypothetical protein [Galbibacter mesophilus]|uniref:hypothetical protein n=1 Tax=Galbibacter mesophilus TaxID=379069 RepID=UPI0019200DE2|nr:hypothetical protein [Galbibacter mesophilus]MCM5662084.1 hypothetical protein [Galbibacter mesophilus]
MLNTNKKIFICFFLLVFCFFLIAPTIITVVEKNAEVSVFYNLAEEEKNDVGNELKEIKQLTSSSNTSFPINAIIKKRENYHYHISHHYEQVIDVIIPPPEFIS